MWDPKTYEITSGRKYINETKVVHKTGGCECEIEVVQRMQTHTFRAPKRLKLIAVSLPFGFPEDSARISHLGCTNG
jgi:hypothetical protein